MSIEAGIIDKLPGQHTKIEFCNCVYILLEALNFEEIQKQVTKHQAWHQSQRDNKKPCGYIIMLG